MKLSRRTLLTASTIATASGVLSRALAKDKATPQKPLSDWAAVRRLFDLSKDETHLGLFFLVSHPKPVREAIERYRKELDRNPLLAVERAMFDFEHPENMIGARVTNVLGRYIGARGEDIALTQNTTSGLALVYHGLPLKAGDDILATSHDHYVHLESIRLATERAGAGFRKIDLYDAFDKISADEIVARIRKAIRPNTRAVGMTWVHSQSGLKLPIRRIADAIAEINKTRSAADRVLLVVDGVHGIGVEEPNVPALGCDAFAAGAHKWLFAPRGTGFVWARPEVWGSMRPMIPSFSSTELFDAFMSEKKPTATPRASWFSPGGFVAFEHYWAVPSAIELHESIGPARITERIHALNSRLKEGLAKMPHVSLYTPRSSDLSSGIVCFDVKGMKPAEVVEKLLEKKIVASTTPYRVPYARFSCGIYNDEGDVDRALTATRTLA
jgi:selenocysteine lyase/cysteine desulfurase